MLLREFTLSDVERVFAYQSHPAYLQFYDGTPPTRDDVRDLVARFCVWATEMPRSRYQLAITRDGLLIGTCGLRKEDPESPDAEFGCEMDPASWGGGYAREACHALVDFGVRTLRLDRIWARTSPGNVRALRLAEDLGLQRTADGLYERRVIRP